MAPIRQLTYNIKHDINFLVVFYRVSNLFGGNIKVEVKKIKLNTPEEVREFVNAAEQCDFDIDIYYNRIIVDAKSFLGIMSLDISQNLSVAYNGYNSNLENAIKKYAVG